MAQFKNRLFKEMGKVDDECKNSKHRTKINKNVIYFLVIK